MSSINTLELVCNIVTENPNRAKVFDKYRIEYCCGGKLPLKDICEKKGVDLQNLINELQQIDAAGKESASTFNLEKSSLRELVNHIENTHHSYLREEIPAIKKLLNRVVARHGAEHTEFKLVQEIFETFSVKMLAHLDKEEQILFPWIRRIESQTDGKESPSGQIADPIAVMMHEHDDAGECLEKFRTLTNDFTPFEEACPTVRVLLQKLHNLESDTHKHVHMENHVLFPKAIQKVKR